MNDATMTAEEIRTHGLQVLSRELGTVGAARFIQQFENGKGDYSTDRHRWLDGEDVNALLEELKKQ